MRFELAFADETVSFEVDDDRIVGSWAGPRGLSADEAAQKLRDAIESPADYPAMRRIVVPGDRVTLAWDSRIPDAERFLPVLTDVLHEAGVEKSDLVILADAGRTAADANIPSVEIHDPTASSDIAYLAATAAGRRIYLNRRLTDADCVIPVGCLSYDPLAGYRGPWSAVFPALSNEETIGEFAGRPGAESASGAKVGGRLEEAEEVSWLLGSQFHLGFVPGLSGVASVVAGEQSAVLKRGLEAINDAWRFRPERRAGVVVVGIGGPGRPGTVADLAAGLASATRLVRRGGKIVVLSRVSGPLGPATSRLLEMEDTQSALSRLRGRDNDPDYAAARSLAEALTWADLYLLSSLGENLAEDLGAIALGRPEEARRLIAAADSVSFVSVADRTLAETADEAGESS